MASDALTPAWRSVRIMVLLGGTPPDPKSVRAALNDIGLSVRGGASLRHQRERPYRSAALDILGPEPYRCTTRDARQHRDVLPAIVGVGNGLRVDGGAGLEFPQHVAAVFIQGDELAGLFAGEK